MPPIFCGLHGADVQIRAQKRGLPVAKKDMTLDGFGAVIGAIRGKQCSDSGQSARRLPRGATHIKSAPLRK